MFFLIISDSDNSVTDSSDFQRISDFLQRNRQCGEEIEVRRTNSLAGSPLLKLSSYNSPTSRIQSAITEEMEKKNTHSTNRDALLFRSESRSAGTTSSDFVLQCQWGNRKRSRCMKVHIKDPNEPSGSGRATARVDRQVTRPDLTNNTSKDSISNKQHNNGYLNLRQRAASPSHRILRNSESPVGMRGHGNGVRGLASPERKGTSVSNNIVKDSNNNHHGGGGGSGSSETAHDGKKGGAGDAIAAAWPPKFVIALTNKEKEEDFLILKGSKLPQRPKKRAKFVQRTLNLVSPGAWLCDLTLERYEVREKKVTKKRPRGLKAMGLMGAMDSDSE